MAKGETSGRDFQFIRVEGGAAFNGRYRNSIPVVAAMMKIEHNDLRLTTDPDYIAPAKK